MTLKVLLSNAFTLMQKGQLEQAEHIYRKVLDLQHRNFDALHYLGIICAQTGRFDLAVEFLTKALKSNPNHAHALFNRGNLYYEYGYPDLAIFDLDKALLLDPQNPSIYFLLGNVYKSLSKFKHSLDFYDKAILINSNYAEAYCNRGLALKELNFLEEAIQSFDRAIFLNSNLAEAFCNRGVALIDLKQFTEAISDLNMAIKINDKYADAFYNLGNAFKGLNNPSEAARHYQQSILIDATHTDAYVNLANALVELKQFDHALSTYRKTFHIDSKSKIPFGVYLNVKMKLCEWGEEVSAILSRIEDDVLARGKSTLPFNLLGLLDKPDLHRILAETYSAIECPIDNSLGPIAQRKPDGKIRLGYYSADFHNHATAYLMAELFETHDKSKFELFAFSFGPNTNDDMRLRVSKAFDQFIDVTSMSDADVSLLSRRLGIDIAVDLKGYTQDSRPGIFAKRCAPVQVNYIGYPGTMGVDYMDYIIADRIVIPENCQHHYSEKIVYLPHSYQVNDSKRIISNRVFTREEVGLPANGFVFCCFNNNYKILPNTFDIWMRILKSVEGSVIWLIDDNPTATNNLMKEAESRGIDAHRLVFAKRMNLDDHLARHRLADLFLDTLPYNAHTTTSDALWAGLPVLTCTGISFASRVAASLLQAIELPELITNNEQDYQAKAIELATNPQILRELKAKLDSNRLSKPLFNAKLFTNHIESAYLTMYQRLLDGLSPVHIYVKA